MPRYRSFREIRQALDDRTTSCERIVSHYLDNIRETKHLNVYLDVYADEAIARARLVDHKILTGKSGVLAGMVVSIKDLICYENHPVEAASNILQGFISTFSATAVERLLAEDAIIIGRVNCDEFGMGSSNEHSAYGPVLNSIDNNRVPGGSSGGSAVAVQADLCTASLGTDTGGSVRQPAAFCNVIGLKPTYSRVSRYGQVAFASSFDTIGIITNTVEDNALILEVIAGDDGQDSTASRQYVEKYTRLLFENRPLKIAWFEEILEDGVLEPEVRTNFELTLDYLAESGHQIEKEQFPLMKYMLPAYYILSTAEASSNLARYDGVRYGYRCVDGMNVDDMYEQSRTDGFGEEVKRRILIGTFVLSADHQDAYYAQAQKVRRLVCNKTRELFKIFDFIVLPSAPETAFIIGQRKKAPLEMYSSDLFTVHASIAGLPAISIPNGSDSSGLPIGLQVMADYFRESSLYAFSHWYLEAKK